MRAVEIIVRGKVQGVFYRVGARETAVRLGIAGTASNEPDGSVRILAEGEDAAVAEFIAWCREGSEPADVARVDVRDIGPTGAASFIIS